LRVQERGRKRTRASWRENSKREESMRERATSGIGSNRERKVNSEREDEREKRKKRENG
jgi:hypothetical protein